MENLFQKIDIDLVKNNVWKTIVDIAENLILILWESNDLLYFRNW